MFPIHNKWSKPSRWLINGLLTINLIIINVVLSYLNIKNGNFEFLNNLNITNNNFNFFYLTFLVQNLSWRQIII